MRRRDLAVTAISAAALAALAIACGVGWRLELESRGWAGLSWTSYGHHAFPIGMAAFVVWALAVCRLVHRVSAARLAGLGAVLGGLAIAGYLFVPALLRAVYGGWGGGLLSVELASNPVLVRELPGFFAAPSSRPLEILFSDIAFWSVWLVPTAAIWGALRLAGVRSRLWSVPLSALVQFWAWPVSIWALAILDHKGGADPAHALKSGFVIPWLVIAVGIPFLATPVPGDDRSP